MQPVALTFNMMFTRNDSITYPEIGVGRLAANNTDQVKLYLDKMITYLNAGIYQQSIDDKLWMKKIIHLSGGDAVLQESIRGWLDEMKDEIESSTLGADVHTYQKTSSDPIQTSLSQSIIDDVNDGSRLRNRPCARYEFHQFLIHIVLLRQNVLFDEAFKIRDDVAVVIRFGFRATDDVAASCACLEQVGLCGPGRRFLTMHFGDWQANST